jgi:hypothetical protein
MNPGSGAVNVTPASLELAPRNQEAAKTSVRASAPPLPVRSKPRKCQWCGLPVADCECPWRDAA